MKIKKFVTDYPSALPLFAVTLVIVGVITWIISYSEGRNLWREDVTEVEAQKMQSFQPEYDQMKEEYEKWENNVAVARNEYDDLQNEIKENAPLLNDIKNGEETVRKLKEETKELNEKSSSLKSEIDNLTKQRDDLQAEIDMMNGEIVKAIGEPIVLPPGMFFQKEDNIPVGRYKATGDSNFFVYNADGRSYVNIILDNEGSSLGVSEYNFVLVENATIETKGGCTLTPIE